MLPIIAGILFITLLGGSLGISLGVVFIALGVVAVAIAAAR